MKTNYGIVMGWRIGEKVAFPTSLSIRAVSARDLSAKLYTTTFATRYCLKFYSDCKDVHSSNFEYNTQDLVCIGARCQCKILIKHIF